MFTGLNTLFSAVAAAPGTARPLAAVLVVLASGSGLVGMLTGVAEALHTFLFIMMALGALTSLVIVVYNMMNGKDDAAKKFILLFFAFAICYGLLFILKETLAKQGMNGNYFYSLSASVSKILLIIVAMVTLVKHSISMYQGDVDAYKKLLAWLVALVVAIVLIDSVVAYSSDFSTVDTTPTIQTIDDFLD